MLLLLLVLLVYYHHKSSHGRVLLAPAYQVCSDLLAAAGLLVLVVEIMYL
jgi:hypothetical protein